MTSFKEPDRQEKLLAEELLSQEGSPRLVAGSDVGPAQLLAGRRQARQPERSHNRSGDEPEELSGLTPPKQFVIIAAMALMVLFGNQIYEWRANTLNTIVSAVPDVPVNDILKVRMQCMRARLAAHRGDSAAEQIESLLDFCQKHYGPRCWQKPLVLLSAAECFRNSKQYDLAAGYEHDGLAALEPADLKGASSELTQAIYVLADAAYNQARYEDAVRLYERVAPLWDNAPAANSKSNMLSDYGYCLYTLKRYEPALACYKEAYGISKTMFGGNTDFNVYRLCYTAACLNHLGRHKEALTYAQSAVDMAKSCQTTFQTAADRQLRWAQEELAKPNGKHDTSDPDDAE